MTCLGSQLSNNHFQTLQALHRANPCSEEDTYAPVTVNMHSPTNHRASAVNPKKTAVALVIPSEVQELTQNSKQALHSAHTEAQS